MSRSALSLFAVLAVAAGPVFAAPPTTGGAVPLHRLTTTGRVDHGTRMPVTVPADNGRCPVLYSEPGHQVFGGAGCAGGGGPNAPRDRAGRLD